MMKNRYVHFVLSVVGVLFLSACDKDPREVVRQQDPDVANPMLIGEWNGIYYPINDDTRLESASLAALCVFRDDKTFSLTLPNEKGAVANGVYEEYQGRSVFLHLQDSSISRVGKKDDIAEFAFEVVGNSLKLHNRSLELKMVRGAMPQPKDPKKENPSGKSLWEGFDSDSRRWRVDIDQDKFELEITLKGRRPVLASGKTIALKSTEAANKESYPQTFTLQPESSVPEGLITQPLRLTVDSEQEAHIAALTEANPFPASPVKLERK